MESDCERCRPLFAELMARLRDLEGQVKDLQQKLNDKSPPKRPQADMPAPPPKKPSGRKPGGQPGHPPHLRELLPADRVTRTVPMIPESCRCCQRPLSATPGPDDPEPTRHQVVELPKIIADVTEYQGHSRKCTGCGTLNTAAIPAEIRARCVGPRLVATCGILSGQLGLSKRNVEEVCNQLLDVPLSLGTVANIDCEIADALAAPYAEVVAAVETNPPAGEPNPSPDHEDPPPPPDTVEDPDPSVVPL